MKIAIINQPLSNRGDEAAHRAFVKSLAQELKKDELDVILLEAKQELVDSIKVDCENVRYIRIPKGKQTPRFQRYPFLFHMFNLSLLNPYLWQFKELIKNYDKIICAPGGICLGGFMSWNHLWQLEIAKKLKKPIYYCGRSIGPFSEDSYSKKIFKKESLKMLNYFSYISLRDSKSVQLANELKLKYDEVVDSAFLDDVEADIPENIQDQLKNHEYVIFVPNELKWHYKYRNVSKDTIDNFYIYILEQIIKMFPDRKIVMLPQTYNSIIDDYKYFCFLRDKKSFKNIIVIDENQSSDIQQKIISKSKLVIGARYHSIVFAINNNIPFIALSYEHKIKGLLETLGLTDSMIEIQNIFGNGNERQLIKAKEQFDVLLKTNADTVSNKIAKDIVRKGFKNFISILKS